MDIRVEGMFMKENVGGSEEWGEGRVVGIEILLGRGVEEVGRMGSRG